MKKIEDLGNLNNKKVLLRLDLNVPLKNNIITDTTRIDKILPTLNFLIQQNSKIIIISHIGRPEGKIDKKLSMLPVCKYLSKKLDKQVSLIDEEIFKIDSNLIFKNKEKKLIILENIRFYKEEEMNSKNLKKFYLLLQNILMMLSLVRIEPIPLLINNSISSSSVEFK